MMSISKHEDSDGTGYCRGCGTTIGEEHHTGCDLVAVDSARLLERMLLSTEESVALIRASTRDQVVQCKFGPGWVALLPLETNRWAFDLVRQMRANPTSRSEP